MTNYNTCLSKSRIERVLGIIIQIRDEVSLIEELNCGLDENFLAHLKIEDMVIALLGVYNPPRVNKQKFNFELDNKLENFGDRYHRIIVCGNCNIKVLDTNRLTSSYLSTLRSPHQPKYWDLFLYLFHEKLKRFCNGESNLL